MSEVNELKNQMEKIIIKIIMKIYLNNLKK